MNIFFEEELNKVKNISSDEREILIEDFEDQLESFEDDYFENNNKKPPKKEILAFIKDFLKKNVKAKEEKKRQSQKESEQYDCIYDALKHEKLHLSIKDMSELLARYDLKKGSSVQNLYRWLPKKLAENSYIEKDSDGKYYYDSSSAIISENSRMLDKAERIKTITMISNLLETIKESPIYEKAIKLCNEITKEAPLTKQNASNRVIFLGAPASKVCDSIWKDIYDAMENNYFISIKYTAPGYTDCVSRGVKPYQLIFDDGIWDLWGYDCIKKQNLLYNLSRISSVEIRKDAARFSLPGDYDFHKVTPGTFGCFRDSDKDGMTHYKIKLAKGSYAESFARERIWGLNHEIQETKEGTVISFDDNQFLPILRWVLGWGDEAEPLEPAELVQAWKEKVSGMSKKVKD